MLIIGTRLQFAFHNVLTIKLIQATANILTTIYRL